MAYNPQESYKSGVDIMQERDSAEAQMKDNPVVDALRVISLYAKAQSEKGNNGVLEALTGLLSSMQGEGVESSEEMPEEGGLPQQPDQKEAGGPMPATRMLNSGKQMNSHGMKKTNSPKVLV